MIQIYIEGHNIGEYGAYLIEQTGLFDGLKAKEQTATNWPSQHGMEVLRNARRFLPREIELTIGFSSINYTRVDVLARQLRSLLYPANRPIRLHVIDDDQDLPGEFAYDVDTTSEELDYCFEDMSSTVLRFTEYAPVKYVYASNGPSVSLTIKDSNTNPMQITWGEYNAIDSNVFSGTLTKTYEDYLDKHLVIVAGVIDSTTITAVSNLTKLYEVLQ